MTDKPASEQRSQAEHDRETRPWRYYELDRATLIKMLEAQADRLSAQAGRPAVPAEEWNEVESGLWERRYCGARYRQESRPHGGLHVVGCPVVRAAHQYAAVPADPEPDVPSHECTTAAVLRKVARHLEAGRLSPVASAGGSIDVAEWIGALRQRADLLDRRIAQPLPREDRKTLPNAPDDCDPSTVLRYVKMCAE